jgi:hypothetical protein
MTNGRTCVLVQAYAGVQDMFLPSREQGEEIMTVAIHNNEWACYARPAHDKIDHVLCTRRSHVSCGDYTQCMFRPLRKLPLSIPQTHYTNITRV